MSATSDVAARAPIQLVEQDARLKDVVGKTLAEAKQLGASSAEVAVNLSQGLSVTVRLGDVETVEHTRDKSLGLTVYFGPPKTMALLRLA